MIGKYKISRKRKAGFNILSGLFSNALFWDVKSEDLSPEKDKNFIIQRVLSRHMNDIKNLENLEKLYPKKEIVFIALNSHEIIGNENIEFVASRYGINPKFFQKYIPNLKQYA